MINIFVLENEAISEIYNTVIEKINNINLKLNKSLQKLKKDYDLYIMFLSLENYVLEESVLQKIINKNVIIFIDKYNDIFLWNITNILNPIDVILSTSPKEIILERLNNNIKKVESEVL